MPQQVLIFLIPQAVSLFCSHLKRHQLKGQRPSKLQLRPARTGKSSPLRPWMTSGAGTSRSLKRDSIYSEPVLQALPGQRYMVVDCCGETVDIPIHQIRTWMSSKLNGYIVPREGLVDRLVLLGIFLRRLIYIFKRSFV